MHRCHHSGDCARQAPPAERQGRIAAGRSSRARTDADAAPNVLLEDLGIGRDALGGTPTSPATLLSTTPPSPTSAPPQQVHAGLPERPDLGLQIKPVVHIIELASRVKEFDLPMPGDTLPLLYPGRGTWRAPLAQFRIEVWRRGTMTYG
jgi:hypothetical protein